MTPLQRTIDSIYATSENTEEKALRGHLYTDRHGIASSSILTVTSVARARLLARRLRPLVKGRTVVEIGAGVGLLAMEVAKIATAVYAIEADPAWTWAWVEHLERRKPANLTWIYGAAQSMFGQLLCDVAIIVTRSGRKEMREAAQRLGRVVIDLYRDYPDTEKGSEDE